MAYRGHEPVEISAFKGLHQQGDVEETPLDHFTDCENIRFIGEQGFGSRYGITPHEDVVSPLGNIKRIYNYLTEDANTLLVLVYPDDTLPLAHGKIYHVTNPTTATLILDIENMQDFAFCPFGGRAYISPFASYVDGDITREKGMVGEFIYVYAGDGTPARPAGVVTPTGNITAANGAAGHTDAGTHLFGVVFESASGALSRPAAFDDFVTSTTSSVSFSTIPVGDSTVAARHIVATKVITNYDGNTTGYEYFFIPGATINDNVTTTLANQSFYDADLIDSADYLLDNFVYPPAGVKLFMYHKRMVVLTPDDNMSIGYVSAVGEPESFSEVDGLIEVPPDGSPLTNGAELRDVMYIMKSTKTFSFVDNDDIPATWPISIVDNAYGAPVHGIGSVIDSGSGNVDFLIVGSRRGVVVFNGRYMLPELSWKIDNFWLTQEQAEFRRIQIVNDAINQQIYITLPDERLLIGNYSNGFDPQNIRWTVWRFEVTINTIALVNVDQLILGATENRIV